METPAHQSQWGGGRGQPGWGSWGKCCEGSQDSPGLSPAVAQLGTCSSAASSIKTQMRCQPLSRNPRVRV